MFVMSVRIDSRTASPADAVISRSRLGRRFSYCFWTLLARSPPSQPAVAPEAFSFCFRGHASLTMPHVERFLQINLERHNVWRAKCRRGAKFTHMARKIGLVLADCWTIQLRTSRKQFGQKGAKRSRTGSSRGSNVSFQKSAAVCLRTVVGIDRI
jgi:hypothetical protein